jgi:nicotinate (nicotinamide) nucleotide adenylyltransferase
MGGSQNKEAQPSSSAFGPVVVKNEEEGQWWNDNGRIPNTKTLTPLDKVLAQIDKLQIPPMKEEEIKKWLDKEKEVGSETEEEEAEKKMNSCSNKEKEEVDEAQLNNNNNNNKDKSNKDNEDNNNHNDKSASDEEEGQQFICYLLVSTGSFSPVHRMHVEMLQAARKRLQLEIEEKEQASNGKVRGAVVGGFLSPSHDHHVKAKLGNEYISAQHRLKMCELAVADSDWISVSAWECQQDFFVTFSEVTKNIQAFAHEQIPGYIFRALFVCGADLVVRCRLYYGTPSFGIIGVARPGEHWTTLQEVLKTVKQETSSSSSETQENHNQATTTRSRSTRGERKFNAYNNFYIVEEEMEDVSSTKIRERLSRGEAVDDLTFPAVAQYLLALPPNPETEEDDLYS